MINEIVRPLPDKQGFMDRFGAWFEKEQALNPNQYVSQTMLVAYLVVAHYIKSLASVAMEREDPTIAADGVNMCVQVIIDAINVGSTLAGLGTDAFETKLYEMLDGLGIKHD